MTYVHFRKSTTGNKAVKEKHAFEQYAATFVVNIQEYHADNGAFNNLVVKESITYANQTIAFSGFDAHHQNGISECMIKPVTYGSRSMLLNAMICCTDIITTKNVAICNKIIN